MLTVKLALYLPNFRDQVTVKELADLTDLAEELDFDSVWTLDRIVVPEASDRGELQYSFGMMEQFPKQLPVGSRRVAAGLAADPVARGQDHEGADRHEHHRHALPVAGRLRRRVRDHRPALQRPLNVGVGAGWMPEEFAAASAIAHLPAPAQARARDHRDHAGHLDQRHFEYHGEFADFEPLRLRRTSRCRSRTRRSTSAA
jgi:FMNH2-dependent dimethyl sulfone monooxygenase